MKLVQGIILLKGVLAMLAPELKKDDSTEGIKELKEGLVGANELLVFIADRAKDGIDLSDAKALWDKISDDDEFKEKLRVAVNNGAKAIDEMKDLDLGEIMELVSVQLDYVPRIISAFKKEISA